MKVENLFILHQGNGLELTHIGVNNKGINFVSRTAQNNGVVAQVEPVEDIEPFPAGYISVALGGSVLSSFVQPKPFYTAFHIMALEPKKEMTIQEKLYYCMCIQANAYRYSYGRQANKTLKDIELPDCIPEWVYVDPVEPIKTTIKEKKVDLRPVDTWREFLIGEFFSVKRGKRIVRGRDYFAEKTDEYCYNVITSTKLNNGVDGYYHSTNCPANSIVCGGEASGFFTTYQPEKCWVMDRARIFTPNNKLCINKYTALFLSAVFRVNQFKYSYGRTPNPKGIEETVIRLPVTSDRLPAWSFMEQYIKSLPYSDRI